MGASSSSDILCVCLLLLYTSVYYTVYYTFVRRGACGPPAAGGSTRYAPHYSSPSRHTRPPKSTCNRGAAGFGEVAELAPLAAAGSFMLRSLSSLRVSCATVGRVESSQVRSSRVEEARNVCGRRRDTSGMPNSLRLPAPGSLRLPPCTAAHAHASTVAGEQGAGARSVARRCGLGFERCPRAPSTVVDQLRARPARGEDGLRSEDRSLARPRGSWMGHSEACDARSPRRAKPAVAPSVGKEPVKKPAAGGGTSRGSLRQRKPAARARVGKLRWGGPKKPAARSGR